MNAQSFGQRLAATRTAFAISPAGLSEVLAGAPSTTSIQTLERDEVKDPVVATLQRLADALGTKPSVLAEPLLKGVKLVKTALPVDLVPRTTTKVDAGKRTPLMSFLLNARANAGLTLRDVEALTGGAVNRATVSALEKGIRLSPRAITAQYLCLAYGVDFDDLARATVKKTKELTRRPEAAN